MSKFTPINGGAPMTPHYLHSIINPNSGSIHGAFCEFIDNSIGANATKVDIMYKRDAIVIIDDGDGLDDLLPLFFFGMSGNRHSTAANNIGFFGQGATAAAIYLGMKLTVHSVHKATGEYRRAVVDWQHVLDTDAWPNWAELGQLVLPASEAPSQIRDGGTVIKIGNRHPKKLGGRTFQGNATAKALAWLYQPALAKGVELKIDQYNAKGDAVLQSFDLKTIFEDGVTLSESYTASGSIEGKSYQLEYGVVGEGTPMAKAGALHVACFPRVITSTKSINGTGLPAKIYAYVLLGEEWKSSLSKDKQAVVVHERELHSALLADMDDLIRSLHEERKRVRINGLNAIIQSKLNDALGGGAFPPRGEALWEANMWSTDDYEPNGNGARGVCLEAVSMGEVCVSDVIPDDGDIVVRVNRDIPMIEEAYMSHPPSVGIIFSEITAAITADETAATLTFGADYVESLKASGALEVGLRSARAKLMLTMQADTIKPSDKELEEAA